MMAAPTVASEPTETNSGYVIFPKAVLEEVRDISNQAVWSLSSCKPGFGIEQLRDNSVDTYWQSDGPQPHLINIQFRRKTVTRFVCIYVDYKSDESYTPNKISIRAGNDFHDLRQIDVVEMDEPVGWVNIELKNDDKYLKTFMIQLAVLGNHQNGRDTHVRQVKVFAPNFERKDRNMVASDQLSSVELAMYNTVR